MIELLCGDKSVVSFFDNFDLIVLQGKLEKRDYLIIHELRGDRTAFHAWEFIFDEADVLGNLNDPNLIFSTLSLNRNDVVAPPFVEPDIKLVNLDLTNAFHGRA